MINFILGALVGALIGMAVIILLVAGSDSDGYDGYCPKCGEKKKGRK